MTRILFRKCKEENYYRPLNLFREYLLFHKLTNFSNFPNEESSQLMQSTFLTVTTSEIFRLPTMEKCHQLSQDVYQDRLKGYKDELKLKIKHWKPQWQELAKGLIAAITIVLCAPTKPQDDSSESSSKKPDNYNAGADSIWRAIIQFPRGHECDCQTGGCTGWGLSILVDIVPAESTTLNIIFDSSASTLSTGTKIPVDQFEKYRQGSEMGKVPINLHGDLIFHLLTAFSSNGNDVGNGTGNTTIGSYWHNGLAKRFENWHFLDDHHLFAGYSQLYSVKIESDEAGKGGKGRWGKGSLWEDIVIGGSLLSLNFLRNRLISAICEYQVKQLINRYFRWRQKMLDTAHKFVNSLRFWQDRDVVITDETYSSYQVMAGDSVKLMQLTCTKNANSYEKVDVKLTGASIANNNDDNDGSNSRFRYVSFWEQAMKDDSNGDNLSELIGELTVADIEWILSTFIQVQWIGEKLHNTITKLGSQFPTAHDRFDSFDPSILRGILAETMPNLRLLSHSQSISQLSEEAMDSTSPIPAAVVDLIESYLLI